MIGHKTNLSKFKKTETISTIFSYHNGMKLGINKRETGKFTNRWKLHNILLNNQCVKEEIKGEIKNYLATNENGNTAYQILQDAIKAVLR